MFAVDSLELAEKRGDRAEYERIVTKTLVHSDSLIAAYRGTARSPRAQAFINKALDEMMGVGHEGHHVMPGTQLVWTFAQAEQLVLVATAVIPSGALKVRRRGILALPVERPSRPGRGKDSSLRSE